MIRRAFLKLVTAAIVSPILNWVDPSQSRLHPSCGIIHDSSIWNVALTGAELKALSQGFSPNLIRPDNLIRWESL